MGTIAATSGISADLDVAGLVSRHCAIVGSTGAGKSNLVTVLLEAIAGGEFSSARVIVIDPHGEYPTALGDKAQDDLVRDWVGHDRPVTVFDGSGLPAEILPTIVGTMLRIVYDTLFWAQELPVGGRHQPLLIVIDEAHRFLPTRPEGGGGDTPAHRTLSTIAKEGRKYGVGLMPVTQRPSEIDTSVLSQCGSMIALRTTNSADRAKVAASLPDDLGGLAELLPSLRTGEGLFLGEAMAIPSRVRVRKALRKPVGNDPKLPEAWQQAARPPGDGYKQALSNWRAQSTAIVVQPGVAGAQKDEHD